MERELIDPTFPEEEKAEWYQYYLESLPKLIAWLVPGHQEDFRYDEEFYGFELNWFLSYPGYHVFMEHFRDYLLKVEAEESWEVESKKYSVPFEYVPTGAYEAYRERWELAVEYGDSQLTWPCQELVGERLAARTTAFKKWCIDHERILESRRVKPEDVLSDHNLAANDYNYCQTLDERIHAKVERCPYTSEILWWDDDCTVLPDGSIRIPEVKEPPHRAFDQDGKELEPGSKDWNAVLRAHYFNWPRYDVQP